MKQYIATSGYEDFNVKQIDSKKNLNFNSTKTKLEIRKARREKSKQKGL